MIPMVENLVTDLGLEEARSYITFMLPRLAERGDALLALLAGQEWSMAAQLAHKTLGSIRAYDDGSLETLLLQVEAKHIAAISAPAFQEALRINFDRLQADLATQLQDKGPHQN